MAFMRAEKSNAIKGRPRNFDPDEALERALQVFWKKGYEGASLTDLTSAMGINRPSLYAAFGDKEALFRRALERYEAGPLAFGREALKQPTARAAVEQLLIGAAQMLTERGTPAGCLMVHGALVASDASDAIRRELCSRRSAGEASLRRRLLRAKAEGDLPLEANAADLARYVMTVIRGMAVQAAGGSTRAELRRVGQTALRAWPG